MTTTKNSFPALVRQLPGSPIKLSYYDTIEKRIGDLSIDIPYEWYDSAHIEYTHIQGYFASKMYERLFYRKDTIAVVLVGPSLLASITPTSIIMEDVLYAKTTAIHPHSLRLPEWGNSNLIPVGFEKERPLSVEAFVPPGRIFYNPATGKVFRNNEWVSIDFVPKQCKSKQYYYQTLKMQGECFVFDGEKMVSV